MPPKRRDIYAVLAGRLREARLAAGLSVEKVASSAGISTSFLSYIESGKRKPSLETVERLAAALGLPVASLVGDRPPAGGGEDYPLMRQFSSLLEDKTPAQKRALFRAMKALSKGL